MSVPSSEEEPQVQQGIPQIPVDLFVSIKRQTKKKNGRKNYYHYIFPLLAGRCLKFTDTFGNLVYESVDFCSSSYSSSSSFRPLCKLLDASGISVFSIFRSFDGDCWKGYKGDSSEDKDLLLTVHRLLNTSSKIEFNILVNSSNGKTSSFNMKGCLFWRSCTIYKDNFVLAQTSLMYKLGLGKVLVRRSRFRVTVFPGFADLRTIAALALIFLDGRN
ncbi:hypothetical protein Droror1_Dr00017594 [Drosera rotundifolia]